MTRNSRFSAFALGFCILLLAGCSDDSFSDPGGTELPELPEWNGRREFIGTMTFAGRDGMEEIDFAREIVRWTSETYAVHPDSAYPTGLDLSEVIADYFFPRTP